MAHRWSDKDKKRVRAFLDLIADKFGGWQGLADALGKKAGGSRGTVQAWHARGRVSLAEIPAMVDLAATHGIEVTASDLNPAARALAGKLK